MQMLVTREATDTLASYGLLELDELMPPTLRKPRSATRLRSDIWQEQCLFDEFGSLLKEDMFLGAICGMRRDRSCITEGAWRFRVAALRVLRVQEHL